MSKICPCCKQSVPEDITGIAIDGTRAFVNGVECYLPPKPMAMLDGAVRAYPRISTIEYLIECVWPLGDEPDSARDALSVYAHIIRKNTGLEFWGSAPGSSCYRKPGYRLFDERPDWAVQRKAA